MGFKQLPELFTYQCDKQVWQAREKTMEINVTKSSTKKPRPKEKVSPSFTDFPNRNFFNT